MWLEDFLKNNHDKKFASTWFDYCGQYMTFKNDIELYFKQQMAEDNSIFAFTFTTQHTNYNEANESEEFINEVASNNGYKIKKIKRHYYGSQMHFIMWKVFKN